MKVALFLGAVVVYFAVGVVYARQCLRRNGRLLDGEAGFVAFLWPVVLAFDILDRLARRGRS